MTATAVWDTRARDWTLIEEQQLPTYEEAIRRAGVREGQRLLDVGCGSGVFLRAAADRGAEVAGLDASEALLVIAREHAPDADLRAGDMEALPWEDDRFDVVTGFSSFFFASDMVAALREAGRVAKPGAPVVIQVWGAPDRCDLTAMKAAFARLVPPPDGPPPAFWEAGALEGVAVSAGLTPGEAFDLSWAYEFPDQESLARGMLAPGPVVYAMRIAGEESVRDAILDALEPYRTASGGYRLENEWHYLIARA
jgi:SAM-dependent methyltransferase